MRIVAGQYGGRRLVLPKNERVRPTADRVREAWMSILGGALGLEALSRGAAHVTFVELHPASLEALERNIAALDVADRVSVYRGDAMRYAERAEERAFDVVLADPPYSIDFAQRLVALFRRHPFGRILSVEHRSDLSLNGDDTRRYGDTSITFCHAS